MVREEVENVLAFDTGDFLPAIPDSERAEYIIRAMKSVQYDAITVGDQELLLGESFFLNHFPRLEQYIQPNLPIIILGKYLLPTNDENGDFPANVVLNGNMLFKESDSVRRGEMIFPSTAIANTASFAVRICGVIAPEALLFFPMDIRGWFEIKPWREALAEMTIQVEGNEFIVLLSHSGLSVDREIAEAFPQIDVIIGGHSQSKLEEPLIIGKTLIIQTPGSGRFVGRLDLKLTNNADLENYQYSLVPMTPELPSDTNITRIIEDYEHAFFTDKIPRPHIPVYPDSFEVASAEVCRRCHEWQYQQWQETPHAHAFEIIVERRKIYNPGCLSCHTTGFGHDSGYVCQDDTPQLINVSCIECHYSLPGHRANPHIIKPIPISKETCVRCHNNRNSPDFNYEKYILEVLH